MMKIIFLTNYYTHHQSAVAESLSSMNHVEYLFVETESMEEERKNMGWGMKQIPSYIVSADSWKRNRTFYQDVINSADTVIIGSAPYELVRERLRRGKLTFFYSERIYKSGYEAYKFPIRFLRFWKKFGRYKSAYLLCASAYTAADFARTFTFLNKAYKWGYFPETKKYDDIPDLIGKKKTASILWTGRFIDWKHPEMAIEIAKRLKADGHQFELKMIGSGALHESMKELIMQQGLEDCVTLLGSMTPEEVRKHMEENEIFLFTSDRTEGWGAVLNEAMNSACAVVASHIIGSVPFMIRDKDNGLIYQDGDVDELYRKVLWLLNHDDERKRIAKNAYYTVLQEWNAESAAKRFVVLAQECEKGNKTPEVFSQGICSKAEVLADDWYCNG